MRKSLYAIAIAALALGWSTTAHAQASHYTNKPIELNVHAGGFSFDDGDTEIMFGARAVYNMANGFGIGGNFGYVDAEGGNVLLYSGEVDYTFPSGSQTHFFVGAGVGAATFDFDEVEGFDIDSQTHLLVPVGGGVKWFNETHDPTWGLRADVRDNIIFVSGEDIVVGGETIEGEDETTHNFEFSGGVSFFFGGGM